MLSPHVLDKHHAPHTPSIKSLMDPYPAQSCIIIPHGLNRSNPAAGLGEIGVEQAHPRFIKGTKEHHFMRVAAGASHSLALTSAGQVWSFGQGSFGALGMPP